MNIILIKNTKSYHQTKYIDIQYQDIRELINEKDLSIKQICSSKILADEMIKALLTETFCKY